MDLYKQYINALITENEDYSVSKAMSNGLMFLGLGILIIFSWEHSEIMSVVADIFGSFFCLCSALCLHLAVEGLRSKRALKDSE